jgi:uncharacterized membrane protein
MRRFADVFFWLGLAVAISGGFTFNSYQHDQKIMAEVIAPGLFFLPAALLGFFRKIKLSDLSGWQAVGWMFRRLGSLKTSTKTWIFALMSLCHFMGALNRYLSFGASWDLAIYANACANGLHSSLRNNTSLLADHFEPVLSLFMPLCSSMDPAVVLIAMQCVASFVGALGVQAFAGSVGWSARLSFIAGMLYLLASTVVTTVYYDFHLYALSLATLPWMLWSVERRHWITLTLICLFHMGLKETTALTVAMLGVSLMFRKQTKVGLFYLFIGGVAFFVIMQVIFPYFRGGQESEYFGKYYGYLGSNLRDMLIKVITRPLYVFQELINFERLRYVFMLLAPTAFIALAAPSFLLIAAPAFAVNILSSVAFMHSGDFHYDAEFFPLVFAASIVGAKKVKGWVRWPKRISPRFLMLAVFTLTCSWTPPLTKLQYYRPSRAQLSIHNVLSKMEVDDHCLVKVVDRLDAHLGRFKNVTLFSDPRPADVMIVAYPQADRLWSLSVDEAEKTVARLGPEFQQIKPINTDASFRVWYREGCDPLEGRTR